MKTARFVGLLLGVLACLGFALAPARADEGMWTFDNFPAGRVQQTYGASVDQHFLDHLRGASVRLLNGCSGAIVSRDGLMMTNHHCIIQCIQDLSTSSQDYVRNGFLTGSRSEERRCPGLQAEVLTDIVDVTPQVNAAVAGRTGQEWMLAREAAMSGAEQTVCGADIRLRCQTISFYRGGQYRLYRYRRYVDVRLVFAPEFQAAFFGGDPDNFNFPRWNFDVAFLRFYEDDHAAVTPDFLRWGSAPPTVDALVFVSGNPGGTERQLTVAQLETLRDTVIPVGQLQRAELRGRLIQFATQGAEARRVSTDPLFAVENAYKVYAGRESALTDPQVMAARRTAEAQFRARVAADAALAAQIGDPWNEIAQAQAAYQEQYPLYRQLEQSAGSASELFDYARMIVRGAQELPRPSGQRLPEFSDSRLPVVERNLFEARPIDPALERLFMEFWLSKTREYLTADSPTVRLMMGQESPEALAERLVAGTHLADPAFRRQLWQGGFAAVVASDDPMIQFALRIDPMSRLARRAFEERVTAPTDRAAERLAQARFAVYGASVYPDATFSLRLTYGRVAGWTHRGVTTGPFTTFSGVFARTTGAEPYALPRRWLEARGRLSGDTVFNFTTTNDIIGGNSGSPVVNAQGELVGVAFDGNIHSLGGDYFYDGALNRTIALSTASVTEALDRVYDRGALLRELRAGSGS